jgi:hypothetical protein
MEYIKNQIRKRNKNTIDPNSLKHYSKKISDLLKLKLEIYLEKAFEKIHSQCVLHL